MTSSENFLGMVYGVLNNTRSLGGKWATQSNLKGAENCQIYASQVTKSWTR